MLGESEVTTSRLRSFSKQTSASELVDRTLDTYPLFRLLSRNRDFPTTNTNAPKWEHLYWSATVEDIRTELTNYN